MNWFLYYYLVSVILTLIIMSINEIYVINRLKRERGDLIEEFKNIQKQIGRKEKSTKFILSLFPILIPFFNNLLFLTFIFGFETNYIKVKERIQKEIEFQNLIKARERQEED